MAPKVSDPMNKRVFAGLVIVLQLVLIILFATTTAYEFKPRQVGNSSAAESAGEHVATYYPLFQDVHVMIFIGFGFLMTFLKKYGYSAVGFNLLIAALVLQWGTLVFGYLHKKEKPAIEINLDTLINADFTAGTVLISFGAVLGKTTPLQLIVMAVLEVVLAKVNENIGLQQLQVVDVGGSMFIHTFGAYFGLAVAAVLYTKRVHDTKSEGATVSSDLFSMIGTVFLWMFWPSFNGALAVENARYRAIVNTYFALTAAAIISFAVSTLVGEKNKLDMVHIQNATLAGGVAIGTTADLIIGPWVALLIGAIAGTVSVLGYRFLTPRLNHRHVHDTCGVNNLHGMPGIIAALAGVLFAGIANLDQYGVELYKMFPARAPASINSTAFISWNTALGGTLDAASTGSDRTASAQAGYQCAALFITIAIAIVGGVIVGFILRIPGLGHTETHYLFDDRKMWNVPEDGYAKDVEILVHETVIDSEKKHEDVALTA